MSKSSIIAFYLPQYRPVEENDRWFRKGFTEWTSVAKTKPLFKGHIQPRVPTDLGFYDLRIPEVREEQVALAKDAGISAFCYYHYWFGNKQTILEKTLQEVVASGSPDFPFCLCWANENWTRRWDGNDSEILISQDYDDEKGWIDHYKYLKLFFADERYLRDEQDRPIFVIYKPQQIPCLKDRLSCFNEMALKDGFNGICFVCQYPQTDISVMSCFDYLIDFEPIESVKQFEINGFKTLRYPPLFLEFLKAKFNKDVLKKTYSVFDYKTIAKSSYKRKYNHKVWRGTFPGWDNTARRKANADIYHNSDPLLFQKYLEKQIQNTLEAYNNSGDSYIFINAWNEWGEGAYLEPDEKYEFAYLEAVKKAREKFNV